MRILHIDTESGFRGGERQVQLLARGLRERGHDQLVAGRIGGEFVATMAADGFAAAEISRGRLFGGRRSLRDIAAAFRPDIVHAHTAKAHAIAFNTLHGKHPIVVTRRVDFALKRNPVSNRKYIAPGVHFIAISNAVKSALIEGGVPASRIDLVHSGVEPSRVIGGDGSRLRAEWLLGDAGPVIGFVGALVDHKAPWVLAEAAPLVRAQLPGARVVFVGEGELRPAIEAIAALHPPSIVLTGWRQDIADCYAAFDLFVMPSKLEGLCTAAIDALAAGVPTIVSQAGGLPDVVENAASGITVKPLDIKALADAIVALWKDDQRRDAFVQAGRERVANLFTANSMVDGTAAVYERLVRPAPQS